MVEKSRNRSRFETDLCPKSEDVCELSVQFEVANVIALRKVPIYRKSKLTQSATLKMRTRIALQVRMPYE